MMGALGQQSAQMTGQQLQERITQLVHGVQIAISLAEKIPGKDEKKFSDGKQALMIGFQLIAQSMPRQ